MADRKFKYYPEDFGELPVKVLHMDLEFDAYDEKTDVRSVLKARALKDIREIALDVKNLEIHEVQSDHSPVQYEYQHKQNKILIRFAKAIPAGQEFTLTTKNTCRPTKNILEGLYYDETPIGSPPTQITQCQQWGFQRLVPCFDDMTAKCTYRTTITARKEYTNIISNGDLVFGPAPIDGQRVKVVYENTKTPMAPYLFFLGVGTYDTHKKGFEYPDGERFMLELLVPPGSDKRSAERALQILYDAVMWTYLFTGRDMYKNIETSKKIWDLVKKRDTAGDAEKTGIRKMLEEASSGRKFGYKYTGTVYREIGMQNSDFGGMENVGNTTVVTNRIMPFSDMTDGSFEYLVRVKLHEYYHNINGSEVTGRSPFEIWLNEAVTVHIEKMYFSFCFGKDYSRLQSILWLLSPDGGTLMQDAGAASMPIEPDGFNDPNELITGITYVKAPEFVRMIQILMGNERFAEGLALYHERFAHSNASREDFLTCMQETSGLDLRDMAECWLKKTGYPVVKAEHHYDPSTRRLTLQLEQENGEWEFPFTWAAFDAHGTRIFERTDRIKGKNATLSIENMGKPAFVSLNRGYTFYGKVKQDTSKEELVLQLSLDDDIIAKFMAFHSLIDSEKLRLVKNPEEDVSEDICRLYFGMLSDRSLLERTGGQILTIFDSVEDDTYAHHYQKLYNAREKIGKAIAEKYEKELIGIYHSYRKLIVPANSMEDYVSSQARNITYRRIKNLCLQILARLDKKEVHELIEAQFHDPTASSDKAMAFSLILDSSSKSRMDMFQSYRKEAESSLVLWEVFLAWTSACEKDDVLDLIALLESSDKFRIEQTNDQRALFGGFIDNKRLSLETEKGRAFLKDTILRLAKVNEYTTIRFLKVLSHIDKMEEKHHAPLFRLLEEIIAATGDDTPSLHNTASMMLTSLQKSMKSPKRTVIIK